jgi:predicted SprT family Zn-dependent metalloprotease
MEQATTTEIIKEFYRLKEVYKEELSKYRIEFDNAKRRLGLCNYRKKVISISKIHLEHTSKEQMLDTLKHEVAHAYSYHHYGIDGRGHNHHFYNACRVVGATPKRCAVVSQDIKKITPKYLGICKVHNVVGEYHRYVSGLSCGQCSKKFDKRYLLEIVKYEDYKGEIK